MPARRDTWVLHHLFPISCHCCPARFGIWILPKRSEVSFAKTKIDLLQTSALGAFFGIGVGSDLYGLACSIKA